jgi:hypothetical protein
MVFLETALESKFNPLLVLGRAGNLGLGGLVNKFNDEAELLDDLVSHPRYRDLIFSTFVFDRMTIGRPNYTRYPHGNFLQRFHC